MTSFALSGKLHTYSSLLETRQQVGKHMAAVLQGRKLCTQNANLLTVMDWKQWYFHQHIRTTRCNKAEQGKKTYKLEKSALDWGRTDRISLTQDLDLDLQSPASYGQELLTQESSRQTVSRFPRWRGNKRMDGQTGGQRRLHYLPH